jgi:hypothetical protein
MDSIEMVQTEVIRKRIQYRQILRNSGYVRYWALFWTRLIPSICKVWKVLDRSQKWSLGFSMIFQIPWCLGLKPLGVIFHREIQLNGEYIRIQDWIRSNRVNRRVTLYLFRLPFFTYSRKATNQELLSL